MNSTAAISSIRSNKYGVYVATTPLRTPTGPPQMLMSTVYSLSLFDLQHYMVIINSANSASREANTVYDFQPANPEDVFTAIAALSGKPIPGLVLTRKLKKLPRRKCWFAGYCSEEFDDGGAERRVQEFNEKWESDLRIGVHDCRNYASELVEFLTGDKFVLENLT